MQTFISHADAGRRNRNSVLHYIKTYGPVFRSEICEKMGMSRASVTQIVRQLQEEGLVVQTGYGESNGGRKPIYVTFNGGAKKLYGFDWRSKMLSLMDLDGNVLYETAVQFESPLQPEQFAAELREKIAKIDAMELCAKQDVLGFGLSLPGLIDSRLSTVGFSAELGWRHVHIRNMFQERFDGRVYVERFTNIMALGEYAYDQEESVSHFQLCVLGSSGIGAATVIRGQCWHGSNYMHGELGHIKLPVDVLCSCGQHGCLEAVVKRQLEESGGAITPEILEYLAMGIATSVNLTDVGMVVLTGDMVERMTEDQRTQLAAMIRERVTEMPLRKLEICFRPDARPMTTRGICAFVFDSYFSVE